jgi:hypothetical protein
MARIKIGSFRPTLETLEGREMMDAGLGHGLQLPVLRPAVGGAGQVGHVRLLHHQLNTLEQDKGYVRAHAEDLVQKWVLDPQVAAGNVSSMVIRNTTVRTTPSAIIVDFQVDYSVWRRPAGKNQVWHLETATGTLSMHFSPVWHGADKFYASHSVSHHAMDQGSGLFPNDKVDLKLLVSSMERCSIRKIWTDERIDMRKFTTNVLNKAEEVWKKLYPAHVPGSFKGNGYSVLPDGTLRVFLYTDNRPFNPETGIGRGELWLDFKADQAQVASGSLKLIGFQYGFWRAGHWTKWDNTEPLAAQFRAANWACEITHEPNPFPRGS